MANARINLLHEKHEKPNLFKNAKLELLWKQKCEPWNYRNRILI